MTDQKNNSEPAPAPGPAQKKSLQACLSMFWHERKLAIVAAWAFLAVSIVAISTMPEPQNRKPVQAAAAAETQAVQEQEPFDITLALPPPEVPLIPSKSSGAKVAKVVAQKEETPKAIEPTNPSPAIATKALLQKEEVQKLKKPGKSSMAKATKVVAQKQERPKVKELKQKKPEPVKISAIMAVVPAAKQETSPAIIKASTKEKPEEKEEPQDKQEQATHEAEVAHDFIQSGDIKQAMAHQHRAVELEPANMFSRFNLAVMHDRVADKEGAEMLYRQVIEAYEKNPKALPSKVSVEDVRRRLDYLSSTDQ